MPRASWTSTICSTSGGYDRTAYFQSKLANLLFSYELDRRLRAAGAATERWPPIRVSCTPTCSAPARGWTGSSSARGCGRSTSGSRRASGWARCRHCARPPIRPPAAATSTGRAAACAFDTGYPARVESSARSHEAADQARLWAESEHLTGVAYAVGRQQSGRYHHGDLKAALVDAAVALIAERGLRGFSLAEASRRVGVSAAAPYRHFADRDDLLAAVAARAPDVRGHGGRRGPRDSPEQQLAAMARAYVRFAAQQRPLFDTIFNSGIDKSRYPELTRAWAPIDALLGLVSEMCAGDARRRSTRRRARGQRPRSRDAARRRRVRATVPKWSALPPTGPSPRPRAHRRAACATAAMGPRPRTGTRRCHKTPAAG